MLQIAAYVQQGRKCMAGGNDLILGGTGKNVFAFANNHAGTSKTTADTNFSGKGGDKIDLRLIDAGTKKDDQAVSLVGKNAFTKAGQVRYEKACKDTYACLDTNREKSVEGVIKVKGIMDFSRDWFVL